MTGWCAAAYVWRKELPDLATEISRIRERGGSKKRTKQTTEEALFALESISARLGIPLQTRPPKSRMS